MKKRRKIDDTIETISITVYTRQLKRIDEALKYSKERNRSAFMTNAALLMAARLKYENKTIIRED